MQAGLRSRDAMIRYLFARLCLPLVCALAEIADAYTIHLLPVPTNFRFVGALGAALIGYMAPTTVLKNITARRVQRMQKGLPDALDLMVICAEAGLSLDATLNRVSRELEATWPELAEEFGITAAELTFLPDRRQAFDNLNARTNLASIRGVVNTLLQTAKFGTPLAQSLRILAAEFRDARMIKAEEKAARLPALLTDAADPVHPADTVHRADGTRGAGHHRHVLGQEQRPAARDRRRPRRRPRRRIGAHDGRVRSPHHGQVRGARHSGRTFRRPRSRRRSAEPSSASRWRSMSMRARSSPNPRCSSPSCRSALRQTCPMTRCCSHRPTPR